MAGPGRCLEATPPNQSLDTDRGRILSIRGVRSLQRPRQVSFIVRRKIDVETILIVGHHDFYAGSCLSAACNNIAWV